MSKILEAIRDLVAEGDIRISDHRYDEFAADGILVEGVLAGLDSATLVEDYPDFPKGPCLLVLEFDSAEKPIHVVWGIARGHSSPAVVVTAYRPDPARWSDDFLERRDD